MRSTDKIIGALLIVLVAALATVVALGAIQNNGQVVSVSSLIWVVGIAAAIGALAFAVARWDFQKFAEGLARSIEQDRRATQDSNMRQYMAEGKLVQTKRGWEYQHDSGVDITLDGPPSYQTIDDAWNQVQNMLDIDEEEWGRGHAKRFGH